MACKQFSVYTCAGAPADKCMVEALRTCGDDCTISCDGEPMRELLPKTSAQEGKEKHVPVITKVEGGYKVQVGSVQHPMEQDHYIEWIELRTEDKVYRQYLKPGQIPEAVFKLDETNVTAYEHCNKHGLWLEKR